MTLLTYNDPIGLIPTFISQDIMKITYLCYFIVHLFAWQFMNNLTDLLNSELPSGLTNFNAEYINGQLIIYSGFNSTLKAFASTYAINITTDSFLNIPTPKQYSLINACSAAYNNSLYLFGTNATDNKNNSNSLCRLDLDSNTWQILSSQLQHILFCEMVISNSSLIIVGSSVDNALIVYAFDVINSSFHNTTIQFYGIGVLQVKQWDGLVINNTVQIEQSPKQVIQVLSTNIFDTSKVTNLLLVIIQSNRIMLLTDANSYNLQLIKSNYTIIVNFFESRRQEKGNLYQQVLPIKNWNFFFNYESDGDKLSLIADQNISESLYVDSGSMYFYTDNWPKFNYSNNKFCVVAAPHQNTTALSIILIVQQTFQSYRLVQNVFEATQRPIGVKSSFFGINQCFSGWTGRNCTKPQCKNTLRVNSLDNMSTIFFECSGHGACINGSCECNSHWGGDDCSTYLPKSCNGTRLLNFPLQNCECFNSTIGGNDCSVKFCPSDCSGHGQCISGTCNCVQNYYGADCSIMMIGFPN